MGNDAVDSLTDRLTELSRESPALERAAGIYRALLPVLDEADLRAAPAILSRDEARERMERGVPLLRGTPPPFDTKAAQDLMIRLARRLEEEGIAGAAPVREAVEQDRLDPSALLRSVLSGDETLAVSAARDLGLDSGLLLMLAHNVLKPALRAWSRQLAPLLEDGRRWERGDCFVCGTPAALGELQGNEQSLHLRCGLCGADWPYSRMRCAHCGSDDHATLGILYPDPGRDKMRVEVCDRCRGYIKVIVTFEPTPPERLPAEDLATLHLDFAARRHGYSRVPVRPPADPRLPRHE